MKEDERGKEGPGQQFPQRVKPDIRPMNPSEIPFYHGKVRAKRSPEDNRSSRKAGPKGKK